MISAATPRVPERGCAAHLESGTREVALGELYLGVMSGTSLDGIDIALTRIGQPYSIELVGFKTVPFEEALRREYLAMMKDPSWEPQRLLAVHHLLGDRFGQEINASLREFRTPPSRVKAIGLHGITFWHCPEGYEVYGGVGRGTMQLCDPYTVAVNTGIRVIHGFRQTDIALGGQGAPMVPFLDHQLFRHEGIGRIMLNLGGIANLSFLPAGSEDISAFDSGPANMIIDHLMRHHPTEPQSFDPSGSYAAKGKVLHDLLKSCTAHPFFGTAPPKSTGREDFGPVFCERFLRYRQFDQYEDLIKTATTLTAVTISDAIRGFRFKDYEYADFQEMIASGGGTYNDTLMEMLRTNLPELDIKTTSDLGVEVDAKEAMLMASLAWAYMNGVPGNFPTVTGASRKAVLGSATY